MDEKIISTCVNLSSKVIEEVKKVVKGKDQIIELIFLSILAGGHVLLEDIPGVGKTTMALSFSKSLGLGYSRIQFTPDVMPSDITGYNMYDKNTQKFKYVKGAVLSNLFLADEINRTSSKTQSALLEVMEEGFVTVDGVRYPTPAPFIVIATQNPIGYAGTQKLPESQLDRFMICLSMGYPDKENELEILKSKTVKIEQKTVVTENDLLAMKEVSSNIFVHDDVYKYAIFLCTSTRNHPEIKLGISPRGTLAVINLAKAKALFEGRSYVIPDDIKHVFLPCANHRVILKSKTSSATEVLTRILSEVTPPKLI